jgi:hypothetical protein
MTRYGAVRNFRGPFPDGDGICDLTARVSEDTRVLRSASGTPGNLSGPSSGYITMRSRIDPQHMIQTLRWTIAEIDPQLALQEVRPLAEAISEVEAPRHFNTELITTFAGGALLLAVIGIYAVMAFSVSQRAQEIAIRMTLSALTSRH